MFHYLLQCPNYKDPRKELIEYIIHNENINLTLGKKVEKLKLALDKFVREAYINKRNNIGVNLSTYLLINLSTYLSIYNDI